MPNTDKHPLKVFLCHAHADRDRVRALYDRLTNDGVDAWLDKENLLPGQDWKLEIERAVREADVVMVCLSKEFNREGFRQKEVRWALDKAMEKPEGEIFIIPARLEECDNLESLRKWHWVDLFEKDGHEMLMRALHARATMIAKIIPNQTNRNYYEQIVPLDETTRKIMVTGGRTPSEKAEKLAFLIGYQVIIRGHILMSNGTNGVDKVSAEGALKACKDKDFPEYERIHVFRPKEGLIPDFDFGTSHIIGDSYEDRRNYVVEKSDVVVIVGGRLGTAAIAEYTLSVGKPLIPIGIGDPIEVAVRIWKDMVNGSYKEKIGYDDLMKIGKHRSVEQIALNSIILAENLSRR